MIVYLSFYKCYTCHFDLQILAFITLVWTAFSLLCKNKWHSFYLNTVIYRPKQSLFNVNFICLINPIVSFSLFGSPYMFPTFLNITHSPSYITAYTNTRLDITTVTLSTLYHSLKQISMPCKELSQSVDPFLFILCPGNKIGWLLHYVWTQVLTPFMRFQPCNLVSMIFLTQHFYSNCTSQQWCKYLHVPKCTIYHKAIVMINRGGHIAFMIAYII